MNIAPAICNRRQPDITVVSREYGAPDEVGSAIFSSSSSDLGIRAPGAARIASYEQRRARRNSEKSVSNIGFPEADPRRTRHRQEPCASGLALGLGLAPNFFPKKCLKYEVSLPLRYGLL